MRNENSLKFLLMFVISLFCLDSVYAHGIDYQVIGNNAIAVKVLYTGGEPISFANVLIFAPDEKIPYLKGKTDKNGVIAFLPDRKGKWSIEITDETEHGMHKKLISLQVEEDFKTVIAQKGLLEKYSKVLTGIGLIIGTFGLIALLRNRKNK